MNWQATRRDDGSYWVVQPGEVYAGEKTQLIAYDLTEADARLVAAAYNSYDKHCGASAVECAEGDLLGEALNSLRELHSNVVSLVEAIEEIDRFKLMFTTDTRRLLGETYAVLAKARRDHETPSP